MTVVRCVVFDVDDTLYLERDYVRSGFETVGAWVEEAFGVSGFAARAWHVFAAGARGDVFDRALAAVGVEPTEELIARLVVRYRCHPPELRLLPDARDRLEELAGEVAIAVVTDGPRESQRAKMGALGLARWALPIVLTAELGEGFAKPHPRGFLKVERAVGVQGAACVYVADNPAKDFAAPRWLGWRTVRVRRPGSLHVAQQSGDDVDVEVTDLSQPIARLVAGGGDGPLGALRSDSQADRAGFGAAP